MALYYADEGQGRSLSRQVMATVSCDTRGLIQFDYIRKGKIMPTSRTVQLKIEEKLTTFGQKKSALSPRQRKGEHVRGHHGEIL